MRTYSSLSSVNQGIVHVLKLYPACFSIEASSLHLNYKYYKIILHNLVIYFIEMCLQFKKYEFYSQLELIYFSV